MKHTINLEPDTDILDGRLLSNLVQLWLDDCRSRLPAYTVAGYAAKVNYFLQWWADVAPWKHNELAQTDLEQFSRWLATTTTTKHKGLSQNTRRDVLRRLSQCLRWAHQKHYTPVDLSAWIPRLRPPVQKRQVVSVGELRQLLAAADLAADPLRDRAALALLIQTGMRRAELQSVRVESITLAADHAGTLQVIGKRTPANPTGERVLAIDAVAGEYLVTYLDTLGWEPGPLLRNAAGEPVSLKTIERIVTNAAARAGLSQAVQGCHDLRRAFVTHFRRQHRGAGYDHLLRLQVGHASDAISDLYDLVDERDLVAVIRGPL